VRACSWWSLDVCCLAIEWPAALFVASGLRLVASPDPLLAAIVCLRGRHCAAASDRSYHKLEDEDA
jgi:hypothetical protein